MLETRHDGLRLWPKMRPITGNMQVKPAYQAAAEVRLPDPQEMWIRRGLVIKPDTLMAASAA